MLLVVERRLKIRRESWYWWLRWLSARPFSNCRITHHKLKSALGTSKVGDIIIRFSCANIFHCPQSEWLRKDKKSTGNINGRLVANWLTVLIGHWIVDCTWSCIPLGIVLKQIKFTNKSDNVCAKIPVVKD